MCGRFTLTKSIDEIIDIINLVPPLDYQVSYNIAPSENVLVLSENKLTNMKWGLVPSWSKDNKKFMINARADTIFEKPSFKESIKKRRCVILADGFYEWDRSSEDGLIIPHYFKFDQEILGFGAIWDFDKTNPEEVKQTCAIITTEANKIVGNIHDRMPVLICTENYKSWISESISKEDLSEIMSPLTKDLIKTWKVSPRVNNAKVKDKDLTLPT